MQIVLPENKFDILKQVIHLQGIKPDQFTALVQGYNLTPAELLELLAATYSIYYVQCQFNQVLAEELHQHRLASGISEFE